MELWMLFLAFALIKIPLLGFMLWLPFRDEKNSSPAIVAQAPEDEGGTKTLPHGPHGQHPHGPSGRGPRPRRGPHGGTPSSPERIRSPLVRVRRVSNCQRVFSD